MDYAGGKVELNTKEYVYNLFEKEVYRIARSCE